MAKKPAKKNKSDLSIEVKDLEPANNPKGGVTATSADQPGTLKASDSSGLTKYIGETEKNLKKLM
ncbi:MAG: hypothetical protein ABI718_04980 [Acidobacteriota bacterium]